MKNEIMMYNDNVVQDFCRGVRIGGRHAMLAGSALEEIAGNTVIKPTERMSLNGSAFQL